MAKQAEKPGRGGARPNSGPKPRFNDNPALATDDPETFLRELMRDSTVDVRLRAEAAKKLLARRDEGVAKDGKKGEQQEAAERAATGRFAPMPPPKLRAVK